MVYDNLTIVHQTTEPGFFLINEYTNDYIVNSSGQFLDSRGNQTFYSWEEMLSNEWIKVEDGCLKPGPNFSEKDGLKYKTGILNISDDVTSIGGSTENESFGYWSKTYRDDNNNQYGSLIKVNTSKNLEIIKDYAFYKDDKLTEVNLSENVKRIGNRSFAFCESLQNIALPENLLAIGASDVDDNYSRFWYKNISTEPEKFQSLSGASFEGCTSLQSITIPSGTHYIGYRSFANCTSLHNVTFEGEDKIISAHAFFNTAIDYLEFPIEGRYIIQKQAFRHCIALKKVKINNYGVGYIEDGAFGYCNNLNDFYVNTEMLRLPDYRESTFNESYVEEGECGLFEGCTSLEKLELRWFELANGHMGERTFYNCTSLNNLGIFEHENDLNLITLKKEMFFNCVSLETISLPETTIEFEENVFGNDNSVLKPEIQVYVNLTTDEWYNSTIKAFDSISGKDTWYKNIRVKLYTKDLSEIEYD